MSFTSEKYEMNPKFFKSTEVLHQFLVQKSCFQKVIQFEDKNPKNKNFFENQNLNLITVFSFEIKLFSD